MTAAVFTAGALTVLTTALAGLAQSLRPVYEHAATARS